MKRSLSIAGSAFVVLLTLALPIFAQQAGYEPDTRYQEGGWWLPEAASDYSGRMDFMYRVIFVAVAFMFLLTEGLLIAFCILYRRRPGHRPTYVHGNNKAELIWTVIPALMLLGIAVWQIPHWNVIKRDGFPDPKAPNVTVVEVMGEQFKWNFRYPGTKSKVKDAEKDIQTTGVIHVPFGDTVLANLRSRDVIHSFFIPLMRVKQDTVPGLRQRVWFKPNRMKIVSTKEFIDDPHGYKDLDGKLRRINKPVWISDEKEITDPKGAYYDKRIALSNYAEVNGTYGVIQVRPSGDLKKVRVLHQGKIAKNQEWASCDYAIGIVDVACAELCGQAHYTMRAPMFVEPRVAFEAWLEDEIDSEAPAFKFWID